MADFGTTLRRARLARGEALTTSSAATGIGVRMLEALERQEVTALPDPSRAVDLVHRYATHLGCDADRLRDDVRLLIEGDDDADTNRLPIIVTPKPARDASLLWIGLGAALGIVILVIATGGLGSGDAPERAGGPTMTTTASPTTAPATATSPPTPPTNTTTTQTLRPTAPQVEPLDLALRAQPGKTVWIEVRRDDASGEQLFAGIVDDGAGRRVRAPGPLWLGVAWAPNAVITLNGETLDAEGGTESYEVTVRGLRRL